MKTKHRLLFGLIALAAMPYLPTGCVASGYVGADVNYGPRPWFGDGPWLDGGVRIDVHPPGFRR